MKKNLILLSLIFATILFFAGCENSLINRYVEPEGEIKSIERKFEDFDKIEAHGGFEIEVTVNSDEKVIVETNENIHQYIIITKVGNKLVIEPERNVEFANRTKILIKVFVKKVSSVTASGATKINITNTINSDKLSISLSGASIFTSNCKLTTLTTDISGASILNLQGSASQYSLVSSGASISNGYDFIIDNFACDISGASFVNHTINKTLNVKASGASILSYRGEGVIKSSQLSGMSIINKK